MDALVEWLNDGRVRDPDDLLRHHSGDRATKPNSQRRSPTARSTTGAKLPRTELFTAPPTPSSYGLHAASRQGVEEPSALNGSPSASSAGSAASTAPVSDSSNERKKDEDYRPQRTKRSQRSSSEDDSEEEDGQEEGDGDSAETARKKARRRPLRPAASAASIPSAALAPATVKGENEGEEERLPFAADRTHPATAVTEAKEEQEGGVCATQAMALVHPVVELRKGSAVTLCLSGRLLSPSPSMGSHTSTSARSHPSCARCHRVRRLAE